MEKANNNLDVMQTEACAPSATTMAAECEVTDATITSEAVNKEKRIVYVDKEDAWLVDFNVEEFKKDMRKLGDELAKSQKGININDEVNHMNMLVGWSSMASMFALFTLGFGINPFTICCLAIASTSRWTIVAHHTSHGGFDDVDSTGKHNRFQFGLGQLQRFSDWIDWMITEAWNIEHNQLHHYRLNEPGGDPDLVEKNALMVRTMNAPEPVKWVIAFFLAATWKFFYYSPNTFKELKGSQYRKHLQSNHLPDDEETESFLENQFTLAGLFYDAPKWLIKAELVFKVLAPYMLFFFGILPLPFYLLCGYDYYISALGNLILGELLGNVYSFAIVGPDMYVYKKRCAPLSGEFYLRQVLSSADFNCGYDVVDFFHGYLNYQVEHHCFPSLSPLCYKIAHPQVKELCKKHNVPCKCSALFSIITIAFF